ncbi:MAG TPA: hypothetical protein VN372_01725 [Methanospirillum sp.]|nr:hypothetical protein [Methanospirillum sp.]
MEAFSTLLDVVSSERSHLHLFGTIRYDYQFIQVVAKSHTCRSGFGADADLDDRRLL